MMVQILAAISSCCMPNSGWARSRSSHYDCVCHAGFFAQNSSNWHPAPLHQRPIDVSYFPHADIGSMLSYPPCIPFTRMMSAQRLKQAAFTYLLKFQPTQEHRQLGLEKFASRGDCTHIHLCQMHNLTAAGSSWCIRPRLSHGWHGACSHVPECPPLNAAVRVQAQAAGLPGRRCSSTAGSWRPTCATSRLPCPRCGAQASLPCPLGGNPLKVVLISLHGCPVPCG